MSQNYTPQQQTYGASAEHPQAQTVFILSLLGFVTSVTFFVAWYMGGKAKKEIEAGAPYRFDGNLKTGYMIGKIFSIIAIVAWALIIVVYAIMIPMALNQK